MATEFRIRHAVAADCENVFNLSNDPLVRSCSAKSGPLSWDGHVAWYSKSLEDPNSHIYIVEAQDGEMMGQVRIHLRGGRWISCMSMWPKFRGLGMGADILRSALRFSGLRDIVGEVKFSNPRSLSMALSAGYIKIGEKEIDGEMYHDLRFPGKTFVVAEMSANHRGDIARAKDIICAAKEAGADAVKIQTYTADTMTLDCREQPFVISGGTLWDGRTLYDIYREAEMPWAWTPELKAHADSLGIELFSTPFDVSAVDFLENAGMERYKIASFEAVDIPLIRRVAATGKPVLISTGICSLGEIREAVDACHAEGNYDVTLLKCTSKYPAKPEEMQLASVSDMFCRFAPEGVAIGLSDHSLSPVPSVVAVALGARVVEKHLTLDRPDGDAESSFALLPGEFAETVEMIRDAESSIGHVSYEAEDSARRYRRSLFAAMDIAKGERMSADNVRSVRPSGGLAPKFLPEIAGRRAARDIRMGEPILWDAVEGEER